MLLLLVPALFGALHVTFFMFHYLFASQTAHVGALYTAFLGLMLAGGGCRGEGACARAPGPAPVFRPNACRRAPPAKRPPRPPAPRRPAGVPPKLAAMTLAYNCCLQGGITHYASSQAAAYSGTGYLNLKEVFAGGLVCGMASLAVWGTVGMGWWKAIGWW